MRGVRFFFLAAFLVVSLAWGQNSVPPVEVGTARKFDVSPPLRDLVNVPPRKPGDPREIPLMPSPVPPAERDFLGPDPAWQGRYGFLPAIPTILNLEGGSSDDNVTLFGFRLAPPDVSMDVGANHIVEMINLMYIIWDKNGNRILGPLPLGNIWSGFGGPCEFNNDGDPIVFYDQIANRWIFTQFAFLSDECVACSQTSDPTGPYFRYQFSTPGNDYPKLGVWPAQDAYSMSYRNFSGAFSMDAVALRRSKILVGDPSAEIVRFSMTQLLAGIDGVLPVDLDGSTAAPAGSPILYLGHQDSQDRLFMFNLTVNWSVPTGTLTGPIFFPVAPYDGVLPDIPQPGTTQGLDELAFATMNRLPYRNFGTHQALVANHTVDVNGAGLAGVRWHELRNTGSGWSLFQEGTYSPNSDNRWMGSIAMDKNGSIALGYSVSSSSVSPSVRFTGRTASDPPGQMTVTESSIIAGTGSQLGTNRWGDYTTMTIDPVDDETFFYGGEYVQQTGSFEWNTRIGSFKIAAGPPPPYAARINSGGPNYTAINGNVFVADKAYTAGDFGFVGGSTRSFNKAIANTNDDPLYLDLRRTAGQQTSFEYRFDVPSGTFTVTLHLMAPTGGGAGDYIMDVSAEGTLVFNDLNINSEAGGTFTALVKTFSTTATDGTLNLNFVTVNKDALVCGIEVVQTSAPELGKDASANEAFVADVPQDFRLSQNHPNPFNPSTRIRYQIPKDMIVTLKIYNLLGEEVRTLAHGFHHVGSYEVEWDGRQDSGVRAPSGIYFYRLQGEGVSAVRKMALLQ